MKTAIDLQKLEQLIRPAAEGQGYELIEIEWRREQVGWVLRLFIDRQAGQGYISHEDCVNVTREVSVLLDVHDVLPANYHLEVSSPGVNRPLKRREDFARFVGKRAKVRLRPEAALKGPPGTEPRRNFTGTIQGVEEEAVQLEVDGQDVVCLPVGAMEKAHLIFEF